MKVKLSKPQAKAILIRVSLLLIMAGQRAGKTFSIGLRTLNYVRYFPRIVGMIAANTYLQLTQSTLVEVTKVWALFGVTEYDKDGNPNGVYVVGKQPPLHFTKFQVYENYKGIISFMNGAVVYIASLDNYLAHEGKTIGWAELDETKDTKKAAVKQVVLARLSQKGLYYHIDTGDMVYSETDDNPALIPYNPCTINTSPAEGTVDWLEELFELKEQDEDILRDITDPKKFYLKQFDDKAVLIFSTFWNKHNLSANYIAKRMGELTESEQLKFIYGYPFSKTGGEWYHEFNRIKHIKPIEFDPGNPVHLSYDFNLNPYMTLVCCQIEDGPEQMIFKFFAEYCYQPPLNTTEAVTEGFMGDYIGMIQDVYLYGDAQGTRGIEGFGHGITRFDDAKRVLGNLLDEYYGNRTTSVNPSVNKRRNIINKIFAGKFKIGDKMVSIEIDPSCIELIKDCQYLKQGSKGKLKETAKNEETGVTYEKYGHTSDAMDYIIGYVLSDFL